ncbi:MAG: amidohydrolase family protein [Dehalococcoidia bacterium]
MKAIDMHVHIPRQPGLPASHMENTLRKYFSVEDSNATIESIANMYRKLDMMALLLSIDSETTTGEIPDSNDYISSVVKKYPDVFIAFAAIDPWKGIEAVEELERAVLELGLKGLKLHPVQQAFFPNDEKIYPLYEKCSELSVPVLFHTGMAASGTGTPGGGGLKLKYSAPIPGMDDVAADFPDLKIILAHPGWPWIDEQIAVALHKPNVFIDLSGWMPRYIPKNLIEESITRLNGKVLFGSDYPFITPERWINDWDRLSIPNVSKDLEKNIFLNNALKIFEDLSEGV